MKKDREEVLSAYLKEVLKDWPEMIRENVMATERECEKSIERKYKEILEDVRSKYREFTEKLEKEEIQKISKLRAKIRATKIREVKYAIDQVMSTALKRIDEMPRDERYINTVHDLISEGLDYIPSTEVIIYVNEKDRAILSKVLEKFNYPNRKLMLGKTPIKTVGGVILSSMDGSTLFDNTFETRLKKNELRIRAEIYKVLFGGRGKWLSQVR